MILRGLLGACAMILGLVAVDAPATATEQADDPVVVVVGDIACDPNSPTFNNGEGTKAGCRQKAVGQVVANANPDAFLAAGDIQYTDGRMSALMASYDKAFGAVKDRTYPVPGDHDYLTPKGADYYEYFGDVAHQEDKGTYAFKQGDWLILAINTINCSPYYPCDEGSWTQRWIAGTLAANPAKCVMAYWHHPIWSAGEHGNFAPGVPVWNQLYDAGVDVVLTGNNHLYQRFHPLGRATAEGLQVGPPQLDPNGMVEFVVGTGGVDNHQATNLENEQFKGAVAASGTDVVNGVFGALQMTLKPDSYDFEFLPAAGTNYTDAGSRGCRTKTLPTGTPPQIDTPTAVRSGDGSATVSWPQPQIPADTAAVSYKVTALGTTKTCTTTSTSCKVTGLTNGSEYRFRVVASNTKAYTTGEYSAALRVGKTTSRPLNATVLPRPSAALVSWDAPADNGGLPVTGYKVTAAPGGKTCTTTTRSCLVPGLTVGSKYTFSVQATNDAGTSSSSSSSAAVVIPAKAPPGPPSIGSLRRAGDGAAGVSVTPSDLPGSVTTTIKVTADPTGRTCTVTLPATECIVTGLTNGSTYTFTAKASSADGTSIASAVSSPLQVGRRPQRPVNAAAVALGGGEAQVSWDAPAWDGGLPITEYRVVGASGRGCTAANGARTCVVTGLTPGTKYTWSVVAVNAAAASDNSVGTPTVTAIGATRPGMPTVAKAERAGDGKAKVTVIPGRDNGLAQRIVVRADVQRPSGAWERVATRWCAFTAPATDCTMEGLTNGLYYRFLAEASNTIGTTALSAPGEPLRVGKNPGRPQNLTVVALPGGQALVTWAPPATDGGLPVTAYTVNTTVGKLSCKTTGELQCTLSGLEAGRTYTVIASASNEAGTSIASLSGPTVVGLP